MTRKYSILCFSVLLFCGACYSHLKNKEEFLTQAERKELAKYRREVEIGRDMTGRLFQFYGSYSNDKLLRYVNEVGTYVAQFSDYNDRHYMFGILDTKTVNAFACPGSYILITTGAIMNMKNEAELAMFLAHEIAHIEKKHLFESLGHPENKDLGDIKEVEPLLRPRQRNARTYTNEASEDITRYLSGATGPGLGMVQASKVGLAILFERGLKKEQELEAERAGLQIGIRANYDPYAMKNFLSRLNKNRNSVDIKTLETTHPKLTDRISTLNMELEKVHAHEIIAATGEERFLRMTEKLKN